MDKPNIIVIMTDQQRGDCLSIDGHPVLLTPNMDSIAGEGVRFSRAYSSCPVCVPARRSFLSGQFPATHGVASNASTEWGIEDTLPGVLRRAGYQTVWVGRSMHQHPPRKRFGFDHMIFADHRVQPDDYDDFMARNQPEGGGGYYGGGVMHNDWTARPWHMEEAYHKTNWTVNEALKFLRTRDPSCPFFLVVSFVAPHPPLIPPAFYMERYLRMDLPEPAVGDWAEPPPNNGLGAETSAARVNLTGEMLRSCRAGYYGLINHVDDQIRRILNPIVGQRKNDAIVVFTSDHGEMLGDHYLWRKSLPYEGSARVPLLVRAPGDFGLKEGFVVGKPVGLEDIMPTLLDMAGVPIPESVEGASLLPLMRGEDAPWRDFIHIENAPTHHSLTDGKEKFIWFVKDGRERFFDLTQDPSECHDLIGDAQASSRIDVWRSRLIDELKNRPEGFSDGARLIPGRKYSGTIPPK
ncbi:MAG: arylsulfatase [Planctomycetes bacterium]|nr:arylsulfatase [Planctomycetota bacterium]